MKIAVVGTGYVGLVTGTCFAEMGNDVTCVDIDETKVKMMKSGRVPIYEPDLEEYFKRNLKEKRLHFTTSLSEGIEEAKVIFLALPTPAGEDGSADLSHVLSVAEELGKILKNYTAIVDKSTVPVGTAERVKDIIAANTKVPFDVVSNPEFLREGFALSDFMKPDRVVIGTESAKARKLLKELYEPFVKQGNPIFFMDERSAEMTKYAANSFLATKISFMNEVANISELVGANIDDVRLGIGADDRIGKRFLFAGIGYGGSCFPKDVKALVHIAVENNYDFKILESVNQVNKLQKRILVNKVEDYFKGKLNRRKFALWGLSFKPDTDDIREAASIEIIEELLSQGSTVIAYDPVAGSNIAKYFGNEPRLTICNDAYEALEGADALLIATEWGEFTAPDFKKIKSKLKQPVIFDGRNIYDLDQMRDLGFYYYSVGRGLIKGHGTK